MGVHSNDVREEAQYLEKLAGAALDTRDTANEVKIFQEVRELQKNPELWAKVKEQVSSDNSSRNGLPVVEISDDRLNPTVSYHVGRFQSSRTYESGSVGGEAGSVYGKERAGSVLGGRLYIPEGK